MKKYIFIISAIVSIAITTYFSLLPLNWLTQANISDLYPTSITPAWFTFSIWSLIYTSWIILWLLIFIWKVKAKAREVYIFSLTILLSAVWLIPWHFQHIFISLIIILIILFFLFREFYLNPESKIFKNILELFLWWVLVATIANFHVFLVSDWSYTNPILFTSISILFWTSFNYILQRNYFSFIPSFVFIWALIWIISKQQNDVTQVLSFMCIIFLILNMIVYGVKKWKIKKDRI